MVDNDYLRGIVSSLPEKPGCYQYLDSSGTIIYVGKAKNLKRRVSSYFHTDRQNAKTLLLVSRIADIRYVVVRTEQDALLLENNLIKRYKPRYNVLLKDDKTYPSIAITHEYLPRIFSTRNRTLRGAEYFGPFSHVPTMHALLDLCRTLFLPRPCRTPMSEEGVKSGRYEVCLDYHIRRCGAPCCGKISREDYLKGIDACRSILRGNTTDVARRLREDMMTAAAELRFEEAQRLKVCLQAVADFQARSEVVTRSLTNVDVFHLETEGETAFINYLHVTEGFINQAFTFEYRRRLDESDAELLRLGIIEMRERYQSSAREIVVPFLVDLPADYALQTVPQRGDKRKLLDLSRLNVKQYRFDRLKQAEKLNPEQKQVRLMREIQRDLALPCLPMRIELFDNSHLSGEDAVAACVVFERLKPLKKAYRKYILRTAAAGDDIAAMQEVIRRRYGPWKEESGELQNGDREGLHSKEGDVQKEGDALKEPAARRQADGREPLPDLIVTDGGATQMEAVRAVVEGELGLHIPVAGLVKDDRHRTRALLCGTPPAAVGMKAGSRLFLTLTAMQDEVHRFAITFHRKRRSLRLAASELDNIPGVGKATKERLLKEFGSVARVHAASLEDLQRLLGTGRGEKIYRALHEKEHDKPQEEK